ncbi:MAG: cupin domain-containing protein [Terriglobales bacterium]
MKKTKSSIAARRKAPSVRKARSKKKSAASSGATSLKGTISKARRKAELHHIPWSSVAIENLNPRLGRQLVVGQNIMLARVLLKKGCIVPEHSHPNEQVTFILEGALKFWIDDREIVVHAGDVLTIPPNMPHKAEAVEDTVDLDVFYPPRADWMSGTDAYLR